MKAARLLKTQTGFSLIELMIVVAIIGILASIAVPNFQKFQRRAKQAEGKGYLSGIYTAENGFKAEWSTFTSDLVCIGFRDANLTSNGALGLAGRGAYRAGFQTESAATSLPAEAQCAAGRSTAMPAAAAGTAIPAAVVSNPTTAPNATSFTAAVAGDINGGGTNDRWQLTEAKILSNSQSGL